LIGVVDERRPSTWLKRANLNVGGGEISPLGQQRFACEFCQCIRETVSEVEASRMAAFAIFAPGGTRNLGLFAVDGNDLQISADK
jgi:hypothetical protein